MNGEQLEMEGLKKHTYTLDLCPKCARVIVKAEISDELIYFFNIGTMLKHMLENDNNALEHFKLINGEDSVTYKAQAAIIEKDEKLIADYEACIAECRRIVREYSSGIL